MRKRPSGTHIIAATLFVLACALAVFTQQGPQELTSIPRAQYADATPLGGKGLRLLLERLGFRTRVQTGVLQKMPSDADVWILLDPKTGFSQREAKQLLQWVKDGNTLIWAASSAPAFAFATGAKSQMNIGLAHLQRELQTSAETSSNAPFTVTDEPLPSLSPLKQGVISSIWNGVNKAQGSKDGLKINRAHLALADSPVGLQLGEIPYGKGRVFVAPDALLFTNYALSKPDNAVLVSNMVRAHAANNAMVVFDERQHGETEEEKFEPNWLYYIWRPPLRYAVIQLFLAAILAAILYGRRLGAPVPLPDGGPVTRASQFAAAMGALFQKVGRPRAAGVIIGEHFRRRLTQRLGLSIHEDDELIAQKAAEATGFSSRLIDRLLLQAKSPDDDEARTLSDAQEMEMILRKLEQRES